MSIRSRLQESLQGTAQWLLHDPQLQPPLERHQMSLSEYERLAPTLRTDDRLIGAVALQHHAADIEVGLDIFNN